MSVVLRLLSVVVLWMFAAGVQAATVDDARNKGLAWLFSHQQGDGSWKASSGLQVQPTAAAMEALMNSGVRQGYAFSAGQAWLGNAETSSTDALARQIIAMNRSGANVSALVSRLISMRHPTTMSWGAYDQFYGSYPDTSLAMDAIFLTGTYYADSGSSLSFISGKQNTDGGWPYTKNDVGSPPSRVVPTAYNLITLSRYKSAGSYVDTYLSSGVSWLASRQKSNGSFSDSDNVNDSAGSVYETAIAWLALAAAKSVGVTSASNGQALQSVMDSAQSYLLAQQQTDGSWGGDPFTSGLALQTLPAVNLADADKDGIPDAVESLLGTNPLAADGRGLIGSNGASGMIQRYAITVTSGEHGYVMPFTSVSVAQGDSLEFAVAADSQYHISSLLVDGNPVAAAANKTSYAYTFSNVAANHTISATFALDQPDITASPSSLSFTTLVCGNTSSAQTVTISNAATATAPLSISSATVSGNEYLIQSNNCTGAVLAAGGSCSVQVAFKPAYKWQRGGNVSIASNDPDIPIFSVPLTGTGADTCPVDPAVLMPILEMLLE